MHVLFGTHREGVFIWKNKRSYGQVAIFLRCLSTNGGDINIQLQNNEAKDQYFVKIGSWRKCIHYNNHAALAWITYTITRCIVNLVSLAERQH